MNEIGKVSIKLIADTDSFFKDIKKAVASISKIKDAEIKITADTSQLKKSISSSISEISKIKNANILIGSDITKLTKGVDIAKSQIDQISKTSASIPLNVDNVKALDKVQQTEARLKILQQRANEISINPSVKTSALQGLELQIASTKNRLDTLNPSFLSSAFSGLGNTANSALSSIRSGLEQTSSVARNLALGVTAGLAGAFLIAGKNAIDYGGQLQQARGDLTVLLGSEEKALKVLKEQQRFAGQTPFETGDLIKSANVLSTVINNVDELNLRTKQLGEASGGIPANLARISNTYSQVVSKGKADTVDLKEFINAGFASVRIEAQKELGVTGEAFEDAVSRGAITADVLNRILNRVTEGYPRLATASKTLTGVFSTASDTIKNFGLSLVGIDTTTFELKAGGIADAISKLVTQFNTEGVVASLAKFGEKIGSTVASLFSGIDFGKVDLAGIVDGISSGFDNVITKVSEFAKIVGDGIKFVVNSVGGLENFNNILLVTATAIGAVSIAMGILNVVSSPVTLTVLAIAGAVSGLAFILGNGDITKGISVIKDGLANAFSRVLPFVQALGKGISELWNTLAENAIVKDVIASFGNIFENLIDIVQQVVTIVGFMWNEMGIGEKVIGTLKVGFVLLGTYIYAVIKIVQGLVATIKQVIDFGGGILEFFGIKAPKEVKKFENQVDSSTESIFGDLKSVDGFDFDVKQVKIENNSKSTQTDLNLVNRFKLDTKPLQISTNSNEAIQQVQSVNNTNIASKFVAITTQSQQAINEIVAVNNTSLQSKTLSIGVANNASPVINEVSGAIRSIPDKTVSLVTKGSQSQVSQEVANIVSYANTALQSRPVVIKTQIQSVASQISSAIRSVPGQSLGGLIKPFASGGKVQSLLGGGLASLIPKGDDTIAGYKFGEFVSKVPVSRKYGGVLNSMNFETPKFDGFMQNVARMTKAIGAMASSNTTNNTNNLPVNINIANLNQQGTSRAVAGIGFMLQSEMLNRGLL